MKHFPKTTFSSFAFPKVDPVRSARLAETMAKLQKRQAAAYARWARTCPSAADAPTQDEAGILDLVAPSEPGGPWAAPETPEASSDHHAGSEMGGDIAGNVMRTIREALAKTGVGMDLGGGMGGTTPAQAPIPDGARFEARTFTSAVGTRNYKLYIPSGSGGQALPVVVMLHGCTQNPDDFATGTRMNAVAEEHKFLVVYPEQSRAANMQRCWNWYEPGDQQREGGEPALIAGMTRQVITEYSADRTRVYAAGLSAGGAAAAVLAMTYPDLFAAIGVHSGLACGSAQDMPSAFAVMKGERAIGTARRHAVPLIVFHGDGDRTVHAANADRVAAQGPSAPEFRTSVTEGRTRDGVAYTRTIRRDAAGRAMVEQWVMRGAGHAWSGGDPAGSFTSPRGPDASREMVRFFLGHTSEVRS
jgi:poly(hydroxyalkanoate) depolymerase family esterase